MKKKYEELIEVIKKIQNPSPADVYKWDNSKEVTMTKGRLNFLLYDRFESCREKVVREIAYWREKAGE